MCESHCRQPKRYNWQEVETANVRFEDDNVIHVSGSVDALRDIEIINTELLLSDLERRRVLSLN